MTIEQSVLDQVHSRLELARNLIQTGNRDDRHRAECERHRAWEMLWPAAFLAPATPDLRRTFEELFPVTPELERQLAEALPCLRDADESAALATAKTLERLSRKSLSMPLEREVGDPRLVLALCEVVRARLLAWRDTKDGRAVTALLVRFFGSVAERMGYAPSTVVYETVHAVWMTIPALRAEVARAMCYLDDAGKWPLIIEVLETATPRSVAPLGTTLNFAGEPPSPLVPRLTSAVLACLRQSKRPQDWITAVGRTAGMDAVVALERLRVRKVPSARLEAIDNAIQRIRRRASA